MKLRKQSHCNSMKITLKNKPIKLSKDYSSEKNKFWWKKFKGDKINEKISRAPRMEDLIFLKLMCYSKWSTDLMQSYQNSEWFLNK